MQKYDELSWSRWAGNDVMFYSEFIILSHACHVVENVDAIKLMLLFLYRKPNDVDIYVNRSHPPHSESVPFKNRAEHRNYFKSFTAIRLLVMRTTIFNGPDRH